jgi:trehalose 6-phosphate phosphatase
MRDESRARARLAASAGSTAEAPRAPLREASAPTPFEATATPPSLWTRWDAIAPCLARGTLLACFDYDGTLVPIRSTPEEAVADATTRAALRALALTPGTAVAVVSGRPVAQLQDLLPADVLWLVGLHGIELARPAGERVATVDVEALSAALGPARALAMRLAMRYAGVRVEDKGATLALHTRQAARDDARAAADAFRAGVAALSVSYLLGFHLLAGKEVLELRPRFVDKGTAVRRLQRDAGCESLLYVGDDATDEDAFAVLASGAPPATAHVLTVRVRERDGEPPTRASCTLGAQAEVGQLLARLLGLRRGGAA